MNANLREFRGFFISFSEQEQEACLKLLGDKLKMFKFWFSSSQRQFVPSHVWHAFIIIRAKRQLFLSGKIICANNSGYSVNENDLKVKVIKAKKGEFFAVWQTKGDTNGRISYSVIDLNRYLGNEIKDSQKKQVSNLREKKIGQTKPRRNDCIGG